VGAQLLFLRVHEPPKKTVRAVHGRVVWPKLTTVCSIMYDYMDCNPKIFTRAGTALSFYGTDRTMVEQNHENEQNNESETLF